jgi:uncharacterized MAPEG superfamily protein
MTTPFWCLLIAIFLPYILAGITVYFKNQQFEEVDVKNPRQQSLELKGQGARANAAQQNAWEALTVFAAAVIVAHLAGADAGYSAIAAIVFLVARILHPVFYITDNQPLRTASFVVGFGCCIWLFVLAAMAASA